MRIMFGFVDLNSNLNLYPATQKASETERNHWMQWMEWVWWKI